MKAKKVNFTVSELHDEIASKELTIILSRIKGIEDADVNYEDGVVSVFYDDDIVNPAEIMDKIIDKGYSASFTD